MHGAACESLLRVMSSGSQGEGTYRHGLISRWVYKQRNLIERYFSKLKHFRGIATRYDRDPLNFLAAVKLASVRIWLKSYESAV